jgi:glycosyltransferase involved in cell wall biosynthesis
VDVAFLAAHVLTVAPNSGGDVLFANIAKEMARLRADWRIAVVAPEYACDGLSPFFRTVVPLPSTPDEPERLGRHPRDVVFTWMRRVRQCADAVARIRPTLVHATGDFFPDVLAARRAKRLFGCRWTGVVHHLNPPPLRRRNELAAAAASYLFQRVSLRAMRGGCERVCLLGAQTRDALLGLGFASERLAVVGAGIDTERFKVAPPPPRENRVLWVHRLEPTKGIFDLPRLAALLPPDVRLDVVGRGPRAWTERLTAELSSAGVRDRVALHGYVGEDELVEFYARANVFISCSYEEGWGISVCEALAVGVPCVAYALPSYDETFPGLVETVPAGDVAALARRVAGALGRKEDLETRSRRSAAVARYSFAAAAERQAAVFSPLLAKPLAAALH